MNYKVLWKQHPKQKKAYKNKICITKITTESDNVEHKKISDVKRTNEKETKINKLHLCEMNNHTQVKEISSFTENNKKTKINKNTKLSDNNMKDIHVKKVSTDKKMPLISHETNKQQEEKSTKVKNKKISIKKLLLIWSMLKINVYMM